MPRKSRRKKQVAPRAEASSRIWLHALASIGDEQWEEAIRTLHRFLEQVTEPQNRCVAYQNLAHCYTSLEQYDAALEALDKAEAASPDSLDTAYNRALVLAYADRLTEAEVVFKHIAKRWRREARQRDVKRSLRTLRDVQKGKLPPRMYLAEHLQAKASDNMDVGDFHLVEQKSRRIIAIFPEDPEGHFGLGIALIEQDRPRGAIDAFMSACTLAPDHAITLYNIGYSYNQLNQPADAIPWLEKAIAADRSYPSPLYQLGLAYEQLDQIEEATQWWQTFLKKAPDDYVALEKLHEYGRSDPPQEPPLSPKSQELQRLIPLAKKRMRRPRRIHNGGILVTLDEKVGFVLEDKENRRNATVYAGGPFEVGIIANDDMLDLMGVVKLLLTTMNANNTRSIAILIYYQSHPNFAYEARFNRKERFDFSTDGRFIVNDIPRFFKLKIDSDISSPLGDPMQGLFMYIKDVPQRGTIITTISYPGAI